MSINRNIADLHPRMIQPVTDLLADLKAGHIAGEVETAFDLFEGYRDAKRQALLFKQRVTKAKPWESAHQYGLGCDIVPFVDGQWSWGHHDYEALRVAAERHGLQVPITWDRCHVVHPLFTNIQRILSL